MGNTLSINANSVIPGVTGYDLANAIDHTFIETDESPVDSFFTNATEINRLFTGTPSQILGNLIILGYVSAIESYFRALFRKLILIDPISMNACEKKQISYGAVMSNKEKMLPEALFEDISFAGKKNIITSVNTFLNLNIQESSLPAALSETLNQFSEICELRHCIVHRFGKFGSKNAITLGLTKYLNHVEKPIKCDFNMLQTLVTICQNTVRISNNLLYERVMNRLILDGNTKKTDIIWTWDYTSDKKLFTKYYKTFYSRTNPPRDNLSVYQMYLKYKAHYLSL